jgi:hypothetical protein
MFRHISRRTDLHHHACMTPPIDGEVKQRKDIPAVSTCLPDGTITELVYDAEQRRTAFAVWRAGSWTIEHAVECNAGERLVPFSPNNNLIKNEVVLLPEEPRDFGSEHELLSDIQSFIHRYVDLRPAFEQIASHYILLTWLYDAFNEMPYLRLRGDWGSGKTRALMTLGSLCYKGFFASGASTVSPIFHILDAFGGTLILDEADFRFSDEKAEIVKILNNGNVRGVPVLRTMMNRQREFNPQAFQVFGPKIVASRGTYQDQGLESRFITEEMGTRKLRPEVPINLPRAFKEEARALRSKLLLYRFHRRWEVMLDESLADPALEPRLNQILLPLLSVVSDLKLRATLKEAAREAQSALVAERGLSIEGQVLEVLADLMRTAEGLGVPVGAVSAALAKRYGQEYERPVTDRWVGAIIRKRLNLRTYKSHGVYVIPAAQRLDIEQLCLRYGIEMSGSAQASGEVGMLGTLH